MSVVLSNNVSCETYGLMWYNVENLFDCRNDSLKNDEDFLPNSLRAWNTSKLKTKLTRISQVIASIGEGRLPTIVGLCEVENSYVLTQLVKYSPLANLKYRYIHFESPDERGIDVAMLYRPGYFTPYTQRAVEVKLPNGAKTRDILYVAGELKSQDTLHVILSHFPSRRGGVLESEPKRVAAANVLKSIVDSITMVVSKPKIVVMGDFNDNPNAKSIKEILNVDYLEDVDTYQDNRLYNGVSYIFQKGKVGTYKYAGIWETIDQIFLSGSLLKGEGITANKESIRVFSPDWLLTKDTKNFGYRPKSNYWGVKYQDGYSDHLPLYFEIDNKN